MQLTDFSQFSPTHLQGTSTSARRALLSGETTLVLDSDQLWLNRPRYLSKGREQTGKGICLETPLGLSFP